MGDHGPRYSIYRHLDAAHREDNNPALIVIPPNNLSEGKLTKLKQNTKKLLTGFDIYATLADIVNVTDVDLKGISLFRDIPEDRTCTSLQIAPQFCICEIESHKLDSHAIITQQLSDYIITYINDALKAKKQHCALLRLDKSVPPKAEQVMLPGTSDKVRAYKLTFQTLPGEGKFFAYLQVDDTSGVRKISKMSYHIYRMNSYRSQAWCTPQLRNFSQSLIRFCYCRIVPFLSE